MPKINLYFVIMFAAILSGCASYRTNSDITFDSVSFLAPKSKIILSEDDLTDRKYTDLGSVLAEVKKLSIFHQDPTKEQVNYVLIRKAEQLNADAVINIKYDGGMGFFTWGYMSGEGRAVKFIEK